MPKSLPQVAGYDFYASYDTALAVGGDYYDAMLLDNGKVCLSFGDVAGKGVPASLVMSRIASVVRSTLQYVDDVGEAVEAINNHMCSSAVEGRFVTYILAIVDTRSHEMRLVIAGHMSPMIRKPDGTIEEFDEESVGVPVGVLEDYPFDVLSRTIQPGETVLIYTDGVSEAMNPEWGSLRRKARPRVPPQQPRHRRRNRQGPALRRPRPTPTAARKTTTSPSWSSAATPKSACAIVQRAGGFIPPDRGPPG